MKRRKFLKLLPVGLLVARFGGLVELAPKAAQASDYQLFYDAMLSEICRINKIPIEILKMEFHQGYSLSAKMLNAQMLMRRSAPGVGASIPMIDPQSS